MTLTSASITHRGKRERNEDSFALHNEEGIFIVADGMGGHHRGDVASITFVEEVLSRLVERKKTSFIRDAISEAVSAANDIIYRLSRSEDEAKIMGTTAVICILKDNRYHIGWAGDSRAYILRKGKLLQVTRDHSHVQTLVDSGIITEKEARKHPERNVISRAIGTEESVETDHVEGDILPGDIFLLCTDGVHGEMDEKYLRKILRKKISLQKRSEEIIKTALQLGGDDNATVILVQVS